jgi:hypothetical protein
MTCHIAIVTAQVMLNLRHGTKDREIRLGKRRPLAWNAEINDIIFFKKSGKEIELQATILRVETYRITSPEQHHALMLHHTQPHSTSREYWASRFEKPYLVICHLAHIEDVMFLHNPKPYVGMNAWRINYDPR